MSHCYRGRPGRRYLVGSRAAGSESLWSFRCRTPWWDREIEAGDSGDRGRGKRNSETVAAALLESLNEDERLEARQMKLVEELNIFNA